MKQEAWIRQLRDKLADYEAAAPEGLWADIEAALPAPAGKSAHVAALRRWAVAASLALLVAGGGYWRWAQRQARSVADGPVPPAVAGLTGGAVAGTPAGEASGGGEARGPVPQTSSSSLPLQALAQPEQAALPEPAAQPESEAAPAADPAAQPQPDGPSPEESASILFRQGSSSAAAHTAVSPQRQRRQSQPQPTALQLGLFASNGLDMPIGQGLSDDGADMLQLDSNGSIFYNSVGRDGRDGKDGGNGGNGYDSSMPSSLLMGMQSAKAADRYEASHRQPVAFGLTASYPLTSRLLLTTGLVYTLLRSEFVSDYPATPDMEQTLHYVGLPLSVQYGLWSGRRLRLYAAGGAQLDWNVSARRQYSHPALGAGRLSPTTAKDRCQFSLHGAVGVQYDLVPQVGLYAEPGLKFYPDNGSQVENFFKEKPTCFNLQVGLRLNFSK